MVLLAILGSPATSIAAGETTSVDLAQLQTLYDQRDYFSLRDMLAEITGLRKQSAQLLFFKAVTQQAFNQPRSSNETIETVYDRNEIPPDLALQLEALRLINHLRLHQYGPAQRSAQAILSSPYLESNSVLASETQNKLTLLEALADVPPQETVVDGPSRLALGNTKRVPLSINGTKMQFALDTGANFSVIMRSEASKLGLQIRPADLVIATSTANKVLGDVAVADTVTVGKVHYRHVVFLVLPDELLSFADGTRIPGLLGFPVVEAMGEVRFRRDNVMEIPAQPQRRRRQNVALDDLDPLVQVRYRKDNLLCRLDTGAGQTVFYEPFFSRYRDRVESNGHSITARAGGVGGIQEIPAYRLPKVTLTLASAGVDLRRVEVYTEPIRSPADNFLFCNVGLDVLGQFRSYTMNFRDMSLTLK